MNKKVLISALAAAVLSLPAAALAGTVTLVPTPPDLYDLDHSRYYLWGPTIQADLSEQTITAATLRFDDIRNHDNSSNVLYVHLLDSAPDGVTTYWDGQGGGDNLAGMGIELVTYTNLPSSSQDLIYELDLLELATLNEYLGADDDIALGFDPDCHFYNRGVSLSLSYDEVPSVPPGEDGVPEPATMFAIAMGISGVGMYARRRRRKAAPAA